MTLPCRRGCALALLLVAAATTPARAKGCHEHSDVVGYQHCGRFGAWSPDYVAPLLWAELADLTERWATHATDLVDGRTTQGGPTHETATAVALRVSGGWRIAPRLALYTGGELAVGGLVARPDQLDGGLDRTSEFFAAHALVGARTIVGRLGLAVELAAGGRYDGVVACPDATCAHFVYATAGHGELDARARVDYWFASLGSVGVAIGQSLVDRSDRELMVAVTVHSRVWDGL